MRIAISGRMHSGKTTIAEYLVSNYGFKRISIGTKLYEMCAQHNKKVWSFFDLLKELLPDASQEELIQIQIDLYNIFYETPHTSNGRNIKLLQKVGQYLRKYDDVVWLKSILKLEDNNEYIVIDDLRDLNDYNYLKDNGFIFIKTQVDRTVQEQRALKLNGIIDKYVLSAPQETELDNEHFDLIVDTSNSISESCTVIDAFMQEHGVKRIGKDAV